MTHNYVINGKENFLSLLRILNIYEGLMKLKFSESLHIN